MKKRWLILWVWLCAFEAHGALVEEIVQIPVEVTNIYWRTHRQSMTLTITVKNTGSGLLTGNATTAAPFRM